MRLVPYATTENLDQFAQYAFNTENMTFLLKEIFKLKHLPMKGIKNR